MTLPPGTGTGGRGTQLLKTVFALLHAGGFDLVQEREQLPLESEQLRAGLAETPVGFGELSDFGEVFGGGRDILRAALAAIGEDGGGVEFSLGAVAGGFATATTEGVERTGHKRLASQKGFEEFLDLLLDRADMGAEGTEVGGHRLGLRAWGGAVCILLLQNIYRFQGGAEKNLAEAKKVKRASREERARARRTRPG